MGYTDVHFAVKDTFSLASFLATIFVWVAFGALLVIGTPPPGHGDHACERRAHRVAGRPDRRRLVRMQVVDLVRSRRRRAGSLCD